MEKVLVIGCSGSGKTTLSNALAQKLRLPVVHLDRLWWYGSWQQRTREEFDLLLDGELQKDKWIIDGNFSRTLPRRLEYCDAVIWLDLPVVVCLWGVTKRVLQNRGKSRPDMGGDCPEHFDRRKIELYRSIIGFNRRNKANYEKLLADSGVKVYKLKSRRQVRKFLKEI